MAAYMDLFVCISTYERTANIVSFTITVILFVVCLGLFFITWITDPPPRFFENPKKKIMFFILLPVSNFLSLAAKKRPKIVRKLKLHENKPVLVRFEVNSSLQLHFRFMQIRFFDWSQLTNEKHCYITVCRVGQNSASWANIKNILDSHPLPPQFFHPPQKKIILIFCQILSIFSNFFKNDSIFH